MNRKVSHKIRKAHRYLGLFLGIQFLMWTISGLYFSWTDLDEIHGDQFKNLNYQPIAFQNLISPSEINHSEPINKIEINLNLYKVLINCYQQDSQFYIIFLYFEILLHLLLLQLTHKLLPIYHPLQQHIPCCLSSR